jgi:hypothetical protein
MILRRLYKAISFILLGFTCFIAWGWAEVLLLHPRVKFLVDGFFYIPFALVSIFVTAYLGVYFLYRAIPRAWLLTVQKYIEVGLCAVAIGFLVSWNRHHLLMATPVWISGNGIAIGIFLISGMNLWQTK